jgi:hypothetical protein
MHPLLGEINGELSAQEDGSSGMLVGDNAPAPARPRERVPFKRYCESCGGVDQHMPGCPTEGRERAERAAQAEEARRPARRSLLTRSTRLTSRILRALAAGVEAFGEDESDDDP